MAAHFHPLTVARVVRETPDCVSVHFSVPSELAEAFRFAEGQNITLKTTVQGEEVRRAYSICKAPFENTLAVAIKKVDGGRFSTYANEELKAGTVLDVMPPAGKFNTAPGCTRHYFAFAAGSGITPVISIIKEVLHREPESEFTLVYGNRNRASVIFFEELAALKNRFMNRFSLIHVLSRERSDADIHHGRIDAAKLQSLQQLTGFPADAHYFICGPEEMIFSVKSFLEKTGIPATQIHFELFSSSRPPRAAVAEKSQGTAVKKQVTLNADGRSFRFDITDNHTTLLDAALDQGADLPYACKGGMCCTCKARLLEGEVKMDVHWGLEQEEIDKGFILTCQAYPVSENVVIDFDVR
jgi:ring-1,2-phenylacetyl-CoA epoxidase subunit PaaE